MANAPAVVATEGVPLRPGPPGCGKLLGMDLPSNPPVSPAVRITVLLRLVSEGFQDAFGARPEWLEAPPVDLAELREVVGVERIGQLREATGLREGEGYAAGGPPGVVRLAAAAHEGSWGCSGWRPPTRRAHRADRRRPPLPRARRLVPHHPGRRAPQLDGVLLLLSDGTQVPVTELPGTGPWTFLVLQPVPDRVSGPEGPAGPEPGVARFLTRFGRAVVPDLRGRGGASGRGAGFLDLVDDLDQVRTRGRAGPADPRRTGEPARGGPRAAADQPWAWRA